ncbi:hypothetical protein VCHA37P193_30069 [Vibrio chagasii]|nr:hypothetical protein VCHA37P193_30069 [Vibrio chagasii]
MKHILLGLLYAVGLFLIAVLSLITIYKFFASDLGTVFGLLFAFGALILGYISIKKMFKHQVKVTSEASDDIKREIDFKTPIGFVAGAFVSNSFAIWLSEGSVTEYWQFLLDIVA